MNNMNNRCVCGGTLIYHESRKELVHVTPRNTKCFILGDSYKNYRSHCPKPKKWYNRWDTKAMQHMIVLLEYFSQEKEQDHV